MVGKIVIDRERCLNTRYKKMACQRCRRQCPSGCINDSLEIDRKSCIECGICLSACPAEAIGGEGYSRKTIETMLAGDDSLLILACRRKDSQSDLPCLGFLDVRLLLALGSGGREGNRQVVVDNRSCAQCKPAVAEYLQELTEGTGKILMAADKAPIVQGSAADRIKRPEKSISRRGFLAGLFVESMRIVQEMSATDICIEAIPRHELFRKYAGQVAISELGETRLFHGISIGSACRACGLCAKICPNQAIVIRDHGDVLDFSHLPQNCVGCGVCTAHCPQEALSLTAARSLAEYHVAKRELPLCPVCGENYQPMGDKQLCLKCLLEENVRNNRQN